MLANIWFDVSFMYLTFGTDIDIMFIRAMLHDEDRFPEPDKFRPERYFSDADSHASQGLAEDSGSPITQGAAENVRRCVFGFGRRYGAPVQLGVT